ncbi:hypothetical protein [Nitrosomonas supralitoralis]|uniref:DUF4381 domain-containing protein n=1 Tax=Nitrosomonas supralitoralis TaxID=2116706 RepID=A0A2P7NYT6_9PROT|nr:hypothetical protein [Nitrosomonas supralitoralis]PSJ18609.1 hypothetical protein C7H79_02125 [Nitrosomonas supralitoralis]
MNDENINQIVGYFETVPLWPFVLFGLLGVVAIMVDIINRKRRALAIDNFRYTIEKELADMYPVHKCWPKNINQYLTSRLPEMYHNFEVLRVFIPQDRLLSYNTDWNKFRDFCRNLTDEKIAAAEQSSTTTKQSVSTELDPKIEFHQLLSNLLKHTHI